MKKEQNKEAHKSPLQVSYGMSLGVFYRKWILLQGKHTVLEKITSTCEYYTVLHMFFHPVFPRHSYIMTSNTTSRCSLRKPIMSLAMSAK